MTSQRRTVRRGAGVLAAGDNPNIPAIGVVDLRTGVVTAVDHTLKSSKGLLFVRS